MKIFIPIRKNNDDDDNTYYYSSLAPPHIQINKEAKVLSIKIDYHISFNKKSIENEYICI